MHSNRSRSALLTSLLLSSWLVFGSGAGVGAAPQPQPIQKGEELQITTSEAGRYGGSLVVGQRGEPKTLNPVLAVDAPSREVTGRMMADLIHINRATQQTEPALAKSWKLSKDGKTFTLKLRHGIRFSDGEPFDADDVVFTFRVYLDEKVHSPQRDLLIIGGKPLKVTKIDAETVRFDMEQPYAAAERIFDGLGILPRHLLEKTYESGGFSQAWALNTAAGGLAGLGPFRLKDYQPGQRLVLERNPYYWKADSRKQRLPYLDEVTFLFVGTEDAQIIRFRAGETDVMSRFNAENYTSLAKEQGTRKFQLADLGPSLEYNFLVFNLNDLPAGKFPELERPQSWFRELKFRQAVSAAIDRASIVRLVFQGRGAPLWGNVTPANKLWLNTTLAHLDQSLDRARELLRSAGFSWTSDGKLVDKDKQRVQFSILASSSNAQRVKMATIIADDLGQLGMDIHVVPLEFRALIERVFQSNNYEASVQGLGGADADPNPEMNVWLSSGSTHIWNLHETKPASAWEAQIDQLMNQQMVTIDAKRRKRLYDQVQQLIAENLPFVFLATPNVLVGAKTEIGNFHPATLDPYVLWNVEELYFRRPEIANAR